jgi:hypothetical protein
METLFSPRMLSHYLAYICNCVPLGSLTFFTPTIVNGLGYSSIEAQLMTGKLHTANLDVRICRKY